LGNTSNPIRKTGKRQKESYSVTRIPQPLHQPPSDDEKGSQIRQMVHQRHCGERCIPFFNQGQQTPGNGITLFIGA
jgi:hypothetical protein